MLVMSATPIPRTLSLIFYGDLDITTITDKPKARQEVATSIISEGRYDDMLDYIGREVRAGKQAYFVCSKIDEDDEEGTLISVKELYEELKARLPFVRFALLHGKMKDREKAEIMRAFKEKQYDCLVSTTVIEVGVDVPNATIMVIYNAERFGLSQLHQLRISLSIFPDCRVPKKSPLPRISKSFSAILNPSVLFFKVKSLSFAVSLSAPINRKQ